MHLHGLIAGLGNPGHQFDLTRHNFGFLAVIEGVWRGIEIFARAGEFHAEHYFRHAEPGLPGIPPPPAPSG